MECGWALAPALTASCGRFAGERLNAPALTPAVRGKIGVRFFDLVMQRPHSPQGVPYGTLKFIRALQERIEGFIADGFILPTLAFRGELGTAHWLQSERMMYRQRREACVKVLAWHFYLTSLPSRKSQIASLTIANKTGMSLRRVQRARRDIIAAGIFERVFAGGGRLSQMLEREGWARRVATFRLTLGALRQLRLFTWFEKFADNWKEKAAPVADGIRGAWMTAAMNQRGDVARRVACAREPPDKFAQAARAKSPFADFSEKEWEEFCEKRTALPESSRTPIPAAPPPTGWRE